MLNFLHDPSLHPGISGATSISVEEFHRLLETGEITDSDGVELVRGQLVEKAPMTPLHATAVDSLLEKVQAILPAGFYARDEKPITLADSEPRPDLCVLRGSRRDYSQRHPHAADIALVVEVALSTLREDREVKRPLYAEAGIPFYWIVNLAEFRIEVFGDPARGEYRQVHQFAESEPVPIVVDGREIGRIALSEFVRG